MAAREISISLETDVFERAKRAAEAEGTTLSAWLSQVVEEAAGLAEAHAALAELDEVYGEPDEETMAKARAELESAGFWTPETEDEAAARHAALARLRGELPGQQPRRAG